MRFLLVPLAATALSAGVSAAAAQAPAARTDSVRIAVVTGISQGLVYLAAGRNDGLVEGTALRTRAPGPAAVYTVVYLASSSAAARGDSTTPLPKVGDSLEYVAPRLAVEGVAIAGGNRPSTAARPSYGRRFRGRIGVRYLSSIDQTSGVALRQPGLELLLDGPVSPASAVAVSADVRSRRSQLYLPGRDAAINGSIGVYQANLRVQSPAGPFRAVAGRQYAPTLAGVGLFDGLLVEFHRPTFGVGVMGGLEPEPGTLAVSSDIRQYGGFVQLRAPATRPVRWSLTTGALGSYAPGGVNREFGFVQATLSSRPVTAILMQEIDYNRGWKRVAGEPALGLTSSYAAVTLNAAESFSISGGLDNRRNVRLYRDLLTPEDTFDDRFRLGMWGGFRLALAGNRLRIDADARSSTVGGSDSLRTTAYSGTISVDRLTALGLGGRLRGTRYRTPGHGRGTLIAGSFRVSPGTTGAIDLTAGTRRESGSRDADRYWVDIGAELFFVKSWFLLATFTREWGRDNLTPTTDLLYTGLSYRF